jgi:phosphomannomutase
MLAATGKTFRQLNQEVVEKYGIMTNERLDLKITLPQLERILQDLKDYQPKAIAGVKVDSIDETEGKKIILEDSSWVLIRPSGTEPLVRVYVEAADPERLKEMRSEVMSALTLTAD